MIYIIRCLCRNELYTVFCRVFSDGGNFCPEEIDVYRKKLENMSSKIDVSEGAIMSDMEDIEKKRLDQATKVASEFEDRYKELHNGIIGF